MKTKFIFGLAIVVCLLLIFLSPFQSPAEGNGECAFNCNSNETVCVANTPAMDPDQRQARGAYCAKQKEECLARCSHEGETERGGSGTVPPPARY